MSCLLFLFTEVGENVTTIVTIVAIVLLCALLVTAILLTLKRAISTREIVFAGICLASSFVLSYIKFTPVTYGGSITLASFVPIIIYSFYFGFSRGIIAGFTYGVLQFVQSPYILTPATFLLDYLLPFAMICLAPLARKIKVKEHWQLVLGTLFTYAGRFLMHFLSGVIFFEMGAVWAELPANTSVVYSLLYQVVYLVPDAIICAIALFVLSKTGVINKILPKQKAGK